VTLSGGGGGVNNGSSNASGSNASGPTSRQAGAPLSSSRPSSLALPLPEYHHQRAHSMGASLSPPRARSIFTTTASTVTTSSTGVASHGYESSSATSLGLLQSNPRSSVSGSHLPPPLHHNPSSYTTRFTSPMATPATVSFNDFVSPSPSNNMSSTTGGSYHAHTHQYGHTNDFGTTLATGHHIVTSGSNSPSLSALPTPDASPAANSTPFHQTQHHNHGSLIPGLIVNGVNGLRVDASISDDDGSLMDNDRLDGPPQPLSFAIPSPMSSWSVSSDTPHHYDSSDFSDYRAALSSTHSSR
jgi:hypothetical protein